MVDTEGMGTALRDHWAAVFTKKDIDEDLLRKWTDEDIGPDKIRAPDYRWKVRLAHVKKAIKITNNSSPGPDGIPYVAWRKAADIAAPILVDVSRCLQKDDWEDTLRRHVNENGEADFNFSILCCLPKKEVGETDDGTPTSTLTALAP